MSISYLTQLFGFRELRNAAAGAFVVLAGLLLAALTYYAHIIGNQRLAGLAAAVSMVFVLLLLIFVVPPLARNAGRETSQMDLPFELTGGGVIMLGLIGIVGFSAWNTGNNLLFLILSFLAATTIIGFFAGSICLKKLDVKMRFPENIVAGEPAEILVHITNRKRIFPTYSVLAEVRGRQRDESLAAAELRRHLPAWISGRLSRPAILRRTLEYFVHIPRNSAVESSRRQVFDRRGRLVIQNFELSTKFPFGIFRHRRRLQAKEAELIVFPQVEPLDDQLDDQPILAGRLGSAKRGSGQDLLALRGYQPHDDQRRVDWKATARSRQLIVREFAAEDDRKVTVTLDTHIPDELFEKRPVRETIEAERRGVELVASERFERGVTLTASLLSHFLAEQAEVRLVIDGDEGEFGTGSRHFQACLRRLAVVEPASAGDTAVSEIVPDPSGRIESHNYVVAARGSRRARQETPANHTIVLF